MPIPLRSRQRALACSRAASLVRAERNLAKDLMSVSPAAAMFEDVPPPVARWVHMTLAAHPASLDVLTGFSL